MSSAAVYPEKLNDVGSAKADDRISRLDLNEDMTIQINGPMEISTKNPRKINRSTLHVDDFSFKCTFFPPS